MKKHQDYDFIARRFEQLWECFEMIEHAMFSLLYELQNWKSKQWEALRKHSFHKLKILSCLRVLQYVLHFHLAPSRELFS